MKKYIFITISILFLQFRPVKAQDLTMNYLSYVYNLYNINPAYCAFGHKFSGIADVRHKSGTDATNAMVGLNGLLSDKQGIGGRLNADTRGPYQVMIADVTYGYKVSIKEHQSIYLGVSAGFYNKSLNTSKIKNYSSLDQDDPVLTNSNFKSTSFAGGIGLIYEYKTLELSVSAPELINLSQHSYNYVILMAANIFHINKSIEFIPMVFYFNTPIVKNLLSAQGKFEYNDNLWFQLGAQTNSLYNIGVGFHKNGLGLGYNYTTSNKLTNVQTSGTHEVILTFRVGSKKRAPYLNKRNVEEHIE
ncbi:MAG: PorP/SprF family type IX secretion system membrane protein [Opitutaceae bacterium]|nr:PorP/SprF family type IX secretion system membrane protein [Cytophagales bacterium]